MACFRFLKEIGCSIGYLILLIFIAEWSCSFRQEVLPYTPVHKGAWCKVHGARCMDNPGNFRPISVVSVLAVCFFSCISSVIFIICLKLIVTFVFMYICLVCISHALSFVLVS